MFMSIISFHYIVDLSGWIKHVTKVNVTFSFFKMWPLKTLHMWLHWCLLNGTALEILQMECLLRNEETIAESSSHKYTWRRSAPEGLSRSCCETRVYAAPAPAACLVPLPFKTCAWSSQMKGAIWEPLT